MSEQPTTPQQPEQPGATAADRTDGGPATTKRPIHKRRWFAPVAFLLGGILIGSTFGGGDENTAAAAEPEPAPTVTETVEPEPAPTVTETVTETVAAAPEPAPAEPAVADADLEAALFPLALQIAWDGMSAEDQAVMCDGIDTFGMDFALDMIESGWDEGGAEMAFDRGAAATFYADIC